MNAYAWYDPHGRALAVEGTRVSVEVRGRAIAAEVVPRPFVKHAD